MRITIELKNRKIKLDAKKCNFFHRFWGLMFCRRENAEILLFDFGKQVRIAIHSWFVFFPFVAVWLDENNKIIEKKIVLPFELIVLPKKSFSKLVEIPVNKRYRGVFRELGFSRR